MKSTDCDHKKARDVGMTQWNGDVSTSIRCRTHVEWCPVCGALRRVQLAGAYRTEDWQLPNSLKEQR